MTDRMRATVEAIEGHEAIVTMWGDLSADGVLTLRERTDFELVLVTQTTRLGLFDIVSKWIVRLMRTGVTPRKEREMVTEIEEALAA